jgi:hypothetical protein
MQQKLAATAEEKRRLQVESAKAFKEAFPTLHSSVKDVVKDSRPQTGFYQSQANSPNNERNFPIMEYKEPKKHKVYKVQKEPVNWTI